MVNVVNALACFGELISSNSRNETGWQSSVSLLPYNRSSLLTGERYLEKYMSKMDHLPRPEVLTHSPLPMAQIAGL